MEHFSSPTVITAMRRLIHLLLLVLTLSSCGSPPAPGDRLSLPELKYAVLDKVGPVWFCDPDFYPVGRPITPEYLDARVKEIQSDSDVYKAILAHNHIDGSALTAAQKQVIYNDYKRLRALNLEPAGQRYRFMYLTAPDGAKTGTGVEGTVDQSGEVQVDSRKAGAYLNCPICLADDTLIDTPQGEIPVTHLQAGMPVWTLDASGRRQEVAIIKVTSTQVPAWHEVVQLRLADGRSVVVSPGHPTVDGRTVGDLSAGDQFDGSLVVSAERVRYAAAATYDLLPAGPTGTYWANGILLASTLR